MADTSTTHLNLVKQDPDSAPDVAKDNSNWDSLDSEIWQRGKTFNGEAVGSDGGFHVNTIPSAENLKTTASQKSEGEFINRTTGGNSSVENSGAFLTLIKGAMTHYNFTPQSINMTVYQADRDEGEDGISVALTNATFVSKVSTSGTYVFTYSSGWLLSGSAVDVTEYGIDVTGTPKNGDTITIAYVKEVRGTIVPATPRKFVSTNWNLYDYVTGTAVVVKYSDEYGFRISGTYLSIKFASTPTGTQTTITPDANGNFTIPFSGYLFIAGGNATDTAVWMTWSDWTNGYKWDPSTGRQGEFEVHTEEEIDLSTVMEECFPDGMFQVGSVRDEFNLSTGIATSKIMRMEYTAENLADVIETGRNYVYDEDYIYVVRSTYVVSDPYSIDNLYNADDHGMEMFTDTNNDVVAYTTYYASLKNKLERDVLTISQQQLSASQKAQVMDNIGAAASIEAVRSGIMNILTDAIMVKEYTYKYASIAASSYLALTATNFGITDISGYTPVGVMRFSTGTSLVVPYAVNALTSGTVMSLKNLSTSAQTNKTASIKILFVKNDLL